MSATDLAGTSTTAQLSLAVDHYNRYPGEMVTIFLRFISPDLAGAKLQLAMPRVMKIISYDLSSSQAGFQPGVIEAEQDLILLIPLANTFVVGQEYIIKVQTIIKTFYFDQYLTIQASLLSASTEVITSEELRIAVLGTGAYLKYLPEIYESDDFTSRFLMLFESFWKPLSKQIDQVDAYFDPMLTPRAFIPWLASWLGLPMDDLLPLDRMRLLIQNAMMLSQCRGTLSALKKYLEIYTSGQIDITERRARNFVLGDGSLGADIALGKKNMPNTVSIKLSIPKVELERTKYSTEMYQRKIIEIVRTQIPAHVAFDINCEFITKE